MSNLLTLTFIQRQPTIQSDFYETDGEDDDDDKTLEGDGITCAAKSWYFVYNSTIKGKYFKYNEGNNIEAEVPYF